MNTKSIMGYRNEMISYLRQKEKEGAMSKKAWGKGKVRRILNLGSFSPY
jgi:hypothetical protein